MFFLLVLLVSLLVLDILCIVADGLVKSWVVHTSGLFSQQQQTKAGLFPSCQFSIVFWDSLLRLDVYPDVGGFIKSNFQMKISMFVLL